jgi:transcriptional regulator with XRE-family HTH domain
MPLTGVCVRRAVAIPAHASGIVARVSPRARTASEAVTNPAAAVGAADGDDEPQIGERIRSLRSEHRMSIRELARRAGVSASLISEGERGLVEPSIGVLKRIATVLAVNLTYFFSQPGSAGETVIREGERRRLRELHGVTFELAGPDNVRSLEPIYGRLQPGADVETLQHEGEEWGMVLRGRLKVWVGSEVYFLEPGDSIFFASSTPHRVANPSNEVTEYIWVNTPASL